MGSILQQYQTHIGLLNEIYNQFNNLVHLEQLQKILFAIIRSHHTI